MIEENSPEVSRLPDRLDISISESARGSSVR
jgi:hypothetical protein